MTTYDEVCRVIGMQLTGIDRDLVDGTVTLVFRPVGHQYGTTTVTLPVAYLAVQPVAANPTKPRTAPY